MLMLDWEKDLTTVYQFAVDSIQSFGSMHSGEECSFMAFASDYYYGHFSISFDTTEHSLKVAQRHEKAIYTRRKKMFSSINGSCNAKYEVSNSQSRLVDYSAATGYFKYPSFATLKLDHWEQAFRSGQLGTQDLEGHLIIFLWGIIDRLVQEKALRSVKIATPFRVGFEFCDNPLGLIVLRIINWPQ